jgi:hypothetical protein
VFRAVCCESSGPTGGRTSGIIGKPSGTGDLPGTRGSSVEAYGRALDAVSNAFESLDWMPLFLKFDFLKDFNEVRDHRAPAQGLGRGFRIHAQILGSEVKMPTNFDHDINLGNPHERFLRR